MSVLRIAVAASALLRAEALVLSYPTTFPCWAEQRGMG